MLAAAAWLVVALKLLLPWAVGVALSTATDAVGKSTLPVDDVRRGIVLGLVLMVVALIEHWWGLWAVRRASPPPRPQELAARAGIGVKLFGEYAVLALALGGVALLADILPDRVVVYVASRLAGAIMMQSAILALLAGVVVVRLAAAGDRFPRAANVFAAVGIVGASGYSLATDGPPALPTAPSAASLAAAIDVARTDARPPIEDAPTVGSTVFASASVKPTEAFPPSMGACASAFLSRSGACRATWQRSARLVRSRGVPAADVDDVLQEALIGTCRSDPEDPCPYFVVVAKNRALKRARGHPGTDACELDDGIESLPWRPDYRIDAARCLELFRRRLCALDPRKQAIVTLRLDGDGFGQIAADLGEREDTVRIAFSRAIDDLRGELPQQCRGLR